MLAMLTFRPENNTVSSASWEMFCLGAAFGEADSICASQLTKPTVSIGTIAGFPCVWCVEGPTVAGLIWFSQKID